MSGTRFGFATPEEAADPTLARNPPVENVEQPNLIPEEKQYDKELVYKVCFDARINALWVLFWMPKLRGQALFEGMPHMPRGYFGCKSYLYCIIKKLDCIQLCLFQHYT